MLSPGKCLWSSDPSFITLCRILQHDFDEANREDVVVNAVYPGTHHSKIDQSNVTLVQDEDGARYNSSGELYHSYRLKLYVREAFKNDLPKTYGIFHMLVENSIMFLHIIFESFP